MSVQAFDRPQATANLNWKGLQFCQTSALLLACTFATLQHTGVVGRSLKASRPGPYRHQLIESVDLLTGEQAVANILALTSMATPCCSTVCMRQLAWRLIRMAQLTWHLHVMVFRRIMERHGFPCRCMSAVIHTFCSKARAFCGCAAATVAAPPTSPSSSHDDATTGQTACHCCLLPCGKSMLKPDATSCRKQRLQLHLPHVYNLAEACSWYNLLKLG